VRFPQAVLDTLSRDLLSPFDDPCLTRRGHTEERPDGFLHFSVKCGRWGAFGYGVDLRKGRLGQWYCAAHRPEVTAGRPMLRRLAGPSVCMATSRASTAGTARMKPARNDTNGLFRSLSL
jgi:hypothetical protein